MNCPKDQGRHKSQKSIIADHSFNQQTSYISCKNKNLLNFWFWCTVVKQIYLLNLPAKCFYFTSASRGLNSRGTSPFIIREARGPDQFTLRQPPSSLDDISRATAQFSQAFVTPKLIVLNIFQPIFNSARYELFCTKIFPRILLNCLDLKNVRI